MIAKVERHSPKEEKELSQFRSELTKSPVNIHDLEEKLLAYLADIGACR